MKILEVLSESFRTDRIAQHNHANKLRELYKTRDKFTRAINKYIETGDNDAAGELRIELDAIKTQIKQAESDELTESTDHNEMLRNLISAHTKASSDLAEMEADLDFMNTAARTEQETDEVYDFRTQVEKKRALVKRLRDRIKLRKAVMGIQS